MKIVKRLALLLFIFVLLLVGVAIAIPIVFKDEMIGVVKEQVNNTINAEADFSDVSLSFFRSFPHLNIGIEDFSLTGKDQFAGVPLVQTKRAGVTVNLKSFFGENTPLEIRDISLDQPNINVLVLADGSANYDITLPDTTSTAATEESSSTDIKIALQSYAINDGQITYDDRAGKTYLAIQDLNHSGSGNLTLTEYDLDTETSIASMTVEQDGIAYLKNATADLDAIFHINMDESKYTLKDNTLQINELVLNAEGFVQLLEEDIKMDLAFNSPGSDFRSLWSMIPNAYTADYADVDIAGTFRLQGLVKGIYNETTYPAFRIKTEVADGKVKYPDLPLGIQDIRAKLDVNSPSSELDEMTIKGDGIHLKVGNDPFDAQFSVKRPISDPDVSATVDGVIDLAQWAKAFPVAGIEEMAGRITADIDVATRLSTIEREDYENVKMNGEVTIDQLRYGAADMPPVVIERAEAQFSPQAVQIDEFSAQLGKSDLQASGRIDNILAYISPEKTMRGSMKMHTNYFLIDEWMPAEEESATTSATPSNSGPTDAEEEEIFDRFNFALDATADKIVYETYEITNAALKGEAHANLVEIEAASMQLGESDFSGNGTITNGMDYALADGTLGGNLNFKSNFLDLNPFMVEPEGTTEAASTTEEEAYGVIPIPDNIDMTMNAQVDRLLYTDMELNDLRGKLVIADEAVVIEEGSAKALGGSMGFAGSYDTKDISAPAYRFKFDLNQLDFGQSFNTFNTFASFAPIGQLVNGQFSSSLIMSGNLGEDMMPILEGIDAEGLLQTFNATLAEIPPLQAVGNALNIKELKSSLNLDNLKSYFTIANGFFEVEPFEVVIADLPMTIAGKHSLSQEMAYTINTVVPRSMLGNGALGNTLNQGISNLVGQANKLGLNLNNAENLNVQINLGGSMTDPDVGFKLLGTNGEASVAQSATDSARDLVQDQVNNARDQVKEEISEVRDQVTEQANQLVDSVRNAAASQLQNAGQNVANE
ncbi:MAG: AsmA-like C-terminal region-containing protein, partial [Bacteroidota bacterium]